MSTLQIVFAVSAVAWLATTERKAMVAVILAFFAVFVFGLA